MFGAMKIEMSSGSFDKKQLIMNTYRETKTWLYYKINMYVFFVIFCKINLDIKSRFKDYLEGYANNANCINA